MELLADCQQLCARSNIMDFYHLSAPYKVCFCNGFKVNVCVCPFYKQIFMYYVKMCRENICCVRWVSTKNITITSLNIEKKFALFFVNVIIIIWPAPFFLSQWYRKWKYGQSCYGPGNFSKKYQYFVKEKKTLNFIAQNSHFF